MSKSTATTVFVLLSTRGTCFSATARWLFFGTDKFVVVCVDGAAWSINTGAGGFNASELLLFVIGLLWAEIPAARPQFPFCLHESRTAAIVATAKPRGGHRSCILCSSRNRFRISSMASCSLSLPSVPGWLKEDEQRKQTVSFESINSNSVGAVRKEPFRPLTFYRLFNSGSLEEVEHFRKFYWNCEILVVEWIITYVMAQLSRGRGSRADIAEGGATLRAANELCAGRFHA